MADATRNLEAEIDRIPFFDTHSHMAGFDLGGRVDDRRGRSLAGILTNDYLGYLAPSCCDTAIPPAKQSDAGDDTAGGFESVRPLLDVCRGLATYAAMREAIREIHPFEGDDIDECNWDTIDRSISRAYREHGERAWQRELMRRSGVFRQVHICHLPYVTRHWAELPAAERQAQAAALLPALILDGYAYHGWEVAHETRKAMLKKAGGELLDCDAYLRACAGMMDRFKAAGGGAVKLLSAYVRPLCFDEVPEGVGRRLYARGPDSLEGADLRTLQDYLVWKLLEMACERNLPLLVHTGYSVPVDYGDPEHLSNLLCSPRLDGLRVGFCHSGWPNEGKAMLLARTWRRCYFDMSWTPLLSPTVARAILGAAVDMVPMNKIMFGTDCGSAECFYGAVKLIRDLIARVLSDKVAEGQFGSDVALSIAEHVLYRNACEFFNEPLPR